MKRFEGLDPAAKKSVFSKEYERLSYFETKFRAESFEFNAQPYIQKLKQGIIDRLEASTQCHIGDDMEHAHLYLEPEHMEYRLHDGRNRVTTFFFDMPESFHATYFEFLQQSVSTQLVDGPFYFQATPNIRIQTPGASDQDGYHRLRSDLCLGHHPREINLWIPITGPEIDHGFKILSLDDSRQIMKDFEYNVLDVPQLIQKEKHSYDQCLEKAKSIQTTCGKVLAFDSRCLHYMVPAKDFTRISIDVRIIPVQDYTDMGMIFKGTTRRQMDFAPGSYFSHQEVQASIQTHGAQDEPQLESRLGQEVHNANF